MMKDELEIDGVDYIKKSLVEEDDGDGEDVEFVEIPDNINLSQIGDILFNDRKQALLECQGDYLVDLASYGFHSNELIKKTDGELRFKDYSDDFVLVRCSREDISSGDTAFRSPKEDADLSNLYYYCKILDHKFFAFVSTGGISVSVGGWRYWWKLVRKDEVLNDE